MFKIIFENQDLLVINKPPGVVVTDAQSVRGLTVQAWMRQQLAEGVWPNADWSELVPSDFDATYGSPAEIFKNRAGIVHRLDKDTSGALVLAKNPGALVSLLAQFKKRSVKKTYQCLVHGLVKEESGEVTAPIARSRRNRQLFEAVSDGRPAKTAFKVLHRYQGLDQESLLNSEVVLEGLQQHSLTLPAFMRRAKIYEGFSQVECKPLTGRTHQIRVHMAHLQHPLVGDVLYAGKKRRKLDSIWCQRQFLHASQVEVDDPRSSERIKVQVPLLEDLSEVLKLFKKR